MNIVLTSNAKFKPYTFDEMLKPLAMATQEYNAIEEGIAELGSKADLMRMYASEEPDSDWAKRYNEYAKELDKQASSLAKYGLSPASRKGLLDLKRAYSSSVSPIEEAAKARKEAYKYRDTVRAKDNTAMFKNNTLSLSDFMNGKEGDNTYISGKDIMARVASKAQIEGTNMFNTLLEQGYSSEAALQAVNNWSRSADNPIIAEELKAVGFENYSPEDQAKLMNSIGTGMYNAASEIAKGEYLTKKERESLRLQELNLAESKKQHSRTLQMNGYKEDGKGNIIPDESSPYWSLKGIEWKDGKPVKINKSNNNNKIFNTKDGLVMVDSNGNTTILNQEGSSNTIKTKSGIPLKPVIVDKAHWGSGWDTAGYEGEDESNFNWFDFNRSTRDWGADYKYPNKEEVEEISVENIDIEALEKIKAKVGTDFNIKNYNFYTTKNGYAGIIAMPKDKDIYKNNNINIPLSQDVENNNDNEGL